jgi:hypothetical protein
MSNESTKYYRHKLENKSIKDIFDILISSEYDCHYIVFIKDRNYVRFPLPIFKSKKDLYIYIYNNTFSLEVKGIGSDNHNILEASYIDSYYKQMYPIK